MTQKTIRSGQLELWTEDFGDPSDATILLLAGAGAQGVSWEDDLCLSLAEAGRHVIRFDYRDAGRSDSVDFGTDPYGLSELAADAVAILDGYGIDTAHLVGASMGGAVAQVVALEHPHRVATLTFISSTPTGAEAATESQGGQPPSEAALPGPTPQLLEAMAAASILPSETVEDDVSKSVKTAEALAGSFAPFDAESKRALALLERQRARSWASRRNHAVAVMMSPSRQGRLDQIDRPTLVIHGTEDPMVPLPHGQALAAGVPGATLLTVEGLGHELPRAAWPVVLDAVLQHTEPAAR